MLQTITPLSLAAETHLILLLDNFVQQILPVEEMQIIKDIATPLRDVTATLRAVLVFLGTDIHNVLMLFIATMLQTIQQLVIQIFLRPTMHQILPLT